MSFEYAIIVKSKTRLETLIERFNTKAQAKFYIERLGGNFDEYEIEDEIFKGSLNSLQTQLSKVIKNKTIDRQYVSSYIFSEKNLIVVIGQDGLVANTAKYSNNLPIIAVNPDTDRYDGVLLPFNIGNFIKGVESVLSDKFNSKIMRFAEAKLNDGQRLLAFNDLFIGASSHVSARYKITFKNKTEQHSSSGIIVSTPAGSTGWLSSIFNMAYGVTNIFEKNRTVKQPKLKENDLLFAVREPFKSIRTQTEIITGIIRNNTLTIESFMPNNGIIFSDGIEKDFINFNSGSIATIGIAKETANIVQNFKTIQKINKRSSFKAK
jgi:NAD kinase